MNNKNIIDDYLWNITCDVMEDLQNNRCILPHQKLAAECVILPGQDGDCQVRRKISDYHLKSIFVKTYTKKDYICTELRNNYILLEKKTASGQIMEVFFDLYPPLDRLLFQWRFNYLEYQSLIPYSYRVGKNIQKINLLLENFYCCIDICEREIVDKFNLLLNLK